MASWFIAHSVGFWIKLCQNRGSDQTIFLVQSFNILKSKLLIDSRKIYFTIIVWLFREVKTPESMKNHSSKNSRKNKIISFLLFVSYFSKEIEKINFGWFPFLLFLYDVHIFKTVFSMVCIESTNVLLLLYFR